MRIRSAVSWYQAELQQHTNCCTLLISGLLKTLACLQSTGTLAQVPYAKFTAGKYKGSTTGSSLQVAALGKLKGEQ